MKGHREGAPACAGLLSDVPGVCGAISPLPADSASHFSRQARASQRRDGLLLTASWRSHVTSAAGGAGRRHGRPPLRGVTEGDRNRPATIHAAARWRCAAPTVIAAAPATRSAASTSRQMFIRTLASASLARSVVLEALQHSDFDEVPGHHSLTAAPAGVASSYPSLAPLDIALLAPSAGRPDVGASAHRRSSRAPARFARRALGGALRVIAVGPH